LYFACLAKLDYFRFPFSMAQQALWFHFRYDPSTLSLS